MTMMTEAAIAIAIGMALSSNSNYSLCLYLCLLEVVVETTTSRPKQQQWQCPMVPWSLQRGVINLTNKYTEYSVWTKHRSHCRGRIVSSMVLFWSLNVWRVKWRLLPHARSLRMKFYIEPYSSTQVHGVTRTLLRCVEGLFWWRPIFPLLNLVGLRLQVCL